MIPNREEEYILEEMSKKNKRGLFPDWSIWCPVSACLLVAPRHPLSLSQSCHHGTFTSDNRALTPIPNQLLDAPENSNGFL